MTSEEIIEILENNKKYLVDKEICSINVFYDFYIAVEFNSESSEREGIILFKNDIYEPKPYY